MSGILFLTTSTTVGGAEKTVYTLATLLDPNIVRVNGVISIKQKGEYAQRLEAAGTRVDTFGADQRAGLRDLQKLALVVHETKPAIVHAVMYQAIQLARAVRKLDYAEYKLVTSPRVNYRTRTGLSLWIDGMLKGADDLLITECDASRRYLIDKLGYKEDKLLTIRNGVDIAGWSISKAERAKKRQELGIKDEEILVGSVGRIDEQKGHIYLLEAIAKLRAVHPAKCVIIGEGPEKKLIERKILEMALHETVRLVGPQKDVPAWLSALDIFVMPSLWEGLPNAILEAMALGIPVVASEVDGIPEAVAHDVSGLLIPPKDPHRLFIALQDLIVDENLRKRLGENARKTVQENFKLVDMLDKYQNAYQKVLQETA